jgi:hypothetical protein
MADFTGIDYKRTLFLIFAALSFVRSLFFVLGLFHVMDTSALVVTANLPTSPQPFAFVDKIFYNAMFVCLKDSNEWESCFKHAEYTDRMPEPYFIGGIAVSHGLSLFLRYPDEPFAREGAFRAMQVFCRNPRIQSARLSKWPVREWNKRKNEVYEFKCPASL